MGIFSKSPKPGNLESDTSKPKKSSRNDVFHGTLADIKSTPKTDSGKPDSRLEDLNRQTFF